MPFLTSLTTFTGIQTADFMITKTTGALTTKPQLIIKLKLKCQTKN